MKPIITILAFFLAFANATVAQNDEPKLVLPIGEMVMETASAPSEKQIADIIAEDQKITENYIPEKYSMAFITKIAKPEFPSSIKLITKN